VRVEYPHYIDIIIQQREEAMTEDWYFLRCETCSKLLGLKNIIDDDGVMNYCLECAKDKELPDKIKDWKYGLGWFFVKKEYVGNKRYD